jgi:trimethylamine---corrinoid protein Co-methyltransferase
VHLSTLTLMSDDDIRAIHQATVDILGTCGVLIENRRMLDFLAERGLPVDRERGIVQFPAQRVADALASVPRRFDVFNREGALAFTLGDGTPRVAAGHNAVFWVDSETGETRASTVADVALCARLCEQLEQIDMIGIPVMPQDVPDPQVTLPYAVRAVIANSRKPLYFSTDQPAVNRACIALAHAACPGRAYAISQLSPTSPLFWEDAVVDALRETVEAGVPLAILPEPNAGVSAPITLAGLLTVNNAECLSGIVMAQLLQPGAPVLYANSWTVTDMRTGAALVGSAETSACRIAGAQIARYYGIPCHTTAPNSDNHAHDEQNAWEKTLSQFCALAAGNDLIVNCGMFATGMTFSHEQLVMDDEITALCRRIARGIDASPESIAADVVKQIGPRGGSYLMAEHTLDRLRTPEHHLPRVAVRGPWTSWQAGGSKDTTELARERVHALAARPEAPIDDARLRALDEIVERFGAANG